MKTIEEYRQDVMMLNMELEQLKARGLKTKRQYYYRVAGCPAGSASDSNCVCWHDEGTGPVPAVPVDSSLYDTRTSPVPAQQAVGMPERFPKESRPEDGWDSGYEAGWNDCLDEVARLNK